MRALSLGVREGLPLARVSSEVREGPPREERAEGNEMRIAK